MITDISRQEIEGTLQDRGKQYGDYTAMSEVAQSLKVTMWTGPMWDKLSAWERESLDAIATKIARIVTGGPGQKDSWHDIGGYAKLSEDRCPPKATP
jgi:hypothetical protein